MPLVALAVVHFGWRWGFGITALLSFLYFLAFLLIYRDPSKHPQLSAEEREYIRAGGATPEGPAQSGEVAMLGYLLRNRKVWGLTIGFAAYGYSFYLFLTWLPNYLVETMHMSILKSAGFSAIPWACATVADLVVGGWLIDHLIARGYDETPVRKTVLVCGMLLGLAVFGATFTTSPIWAVVWISIALSGLAAAAPVGWSIPSLIAPQRRHRYDRRHHELREQPDGDRWPHRDRFYRWYQRRICWRISGRGYRSGRRYRRLCVRARPAGPDPEPGVGG